MKRHLALTIEVSPAQLETLAVLDDQGDPPASLWPSCSSASWTA